MLNEAVRKQLLSNHEVYQPRRWEGKSIPFKIKYLCANYPEIAVGWIGLGIILPLVMCYKYINEENSLSYAMRKFRRYYTVVRDDDPDRPRLEKQKEIGKEFFPQ